jgi:hypothetical protein
MNDAMVHFGLSIEGYDNVPDNVPQFRAQYWSD